MIYFLGRCPDCDEQYYEVCPCGYDPSDEDNEYDS
jgi:hypothetical protein